MATSVISGPQRKLALVIGISNYEKATDLPNAINDAEAISSALKSIGFVLHKGGPKLNPTYEEMRLALVAFECSIKTGDMVLFYYAGHGTQWEDQNYLIPSDNFKEEIKSDVMEKVELSGSDLRKCAINAQDFLNVINDQDPFVTMFFLDCCRTYHLRDSKPQQNSRGEQINHSQGLKSMPVKVGSLIAFACAPGTVADDGEAEETNGLFTKHLLKHIITPNDDIRMVLSDVTNGVIQESKSQQIPHVTSILTHRDIFLYNHISDSSQSSHPAPNASTVSKNAMTSSQSRSIPKPGTFHYSMKKSNSYTSLTTMNRCGDRFTDIQLENKPLPEYYNYSNHELLSLEAATNELQGVLKDKNCFVEKAKKYCTYPNEHNLSKDESAAIYIFTMEMPHDSCVYRILNQTLRAEDQSKVRPWFGYLKLLDSAVSKLPTFKGTIWRGINKDVTMNFKNGQRITWWSISSCSTSLDFISSFISKSSPGTLFHIECLNGKSISSYTCYPDDKEVVLMSGTKFEVVSILLKHEGGLNVIHLKEINNNGDDNDYFYDYKESEEKESPRPSNSSGPKLNPTCNEIRHALVDFLGSIKMGDMVLFYYAGHGIQWEDKNYLIPSDNFKEELKDNIIEKVKLSGADLKQRAINVQNLLNDINDQDPFVTMFFLDCCRTYHLRDSKPQQNSRGEQINHSQGLRPMPAKVGSLIAFACAPGTVADDGEAEETNGLFTKHLLKHITTPNEDIRMILADVTDGVIEESKSQQIPHVTSILRRKNICLYNHISGRSYIEGYIYFMTVRGKTIYDQHRSKYLVKEDKYGLNFAKNELSRDKMDRIDNDVGLETYEPNCNYLCLLSVWYRHLRVLYCILWMLCT
ncbi:unnamed protein product [Adineta steineri]|uniref:NAD(P)(+)--arginine ADP-ribosyltransferase n=1 Tax=Adineta steineri TaxID=433720 RepID=A0A815GP08_9BILA|nr:unnamed protein product [Adineta steineri]